MLRTYKGDITSLEPHQIAVFGSNTEGRHGMGFALWCYKNAGAIRGQAEGLQGQSYGLITKDLTKSTHPSVSDWEIMSGIGKLYIVASALSHKEFLIPYKGYGTNLNNYTPEEMARLFVRVEEHGKKLARDFGLVHIQDDPVPPNVIFEESFFELMNKIKDENSKGV
jgi:hypothetical protein